MVPRSYGERQCLYCPCFQWVTRWSFDWFESGFEGADFWVSASAMAHCQLLFVAQGAPVLPARPKVEQTQGTELVRTSSAVDRQPFLQNFLVAGVEVGGHPCFFAERIGLSF